jgi:hypothetical protein
MPGIVPRALHARLHPVCSARAPLGLVVDSGLPRAALFVDVVVDR